MATTQAPTEPRRRGPRWPAPWPEIALPLAVAVFQVVGSVGAADNQPDRDPLDALAFLLLLVGPAVLTQRRRRPSVAAGVTLAATLTYVGLGYPYGPVFVSPVIALFATVLTGRRVAAWLWAAAGYVALLAIGFLGDDRPSLLHATAVAAWLLLVLVVADMARVRGERAAEAERAHEEQARRRAGEERMRMARELHDVLAHNISLINVQAGVALHLMDEQPEQARTALTAIKGASKEALGELRSVLGVLRGVDEDEPRDPAPGLARLGGLTAGAEAAGLAVHTVTEGEPRPLAAGLDLAAYRIVQEALTNVARHAGARTATVRVAYGATDLVVEVDDDGRGPVAGRGLADDAGTGSGIAGMRERAAALGGDLYAGPRPGGGFRVRVRLPLEPPG
ncbi:MAG TPA: sensor histidine kinase [Acidimicrobiales bacterium]|nr:sensor histidine kinase [Acidimicrobiales bacterium]